MSPVISKSKAKAIWIRSQGLDQKAPFGQGSEATAKAIKHLGYVQIDTINVIERCHHHILYSRIPDYQLSHLHQAQTIDKTIFEYWTHALAYVPTDDFKFFMPAMKQHRLKPNQWFKNVKPEEMKKVLGLIKKNGAISIRDIQDDELVEKNHAWGSRKPSKKALQYGFYCGDLVISERVGMLKKYELTGRHFCWKSKPKAATEHEYNVYIANRALKSQGIVSLDSICHLAASKKTAVKDFLTKEVKKENLVTVHVEGDSKNKYWVPGKLLEDKIDIDSEHAHILSPFDPLIIQRKRLNLFFDYDHRFEAYIPKEKRIYGYFALPVLVGDRIVAALDLKTDRANNKLLMQKWTWIGKEKSKTNKVMIEQALGRFEKFQLQK